MKKSKLTSINMLSHIDDINYTSADGSFSFNFPRHNLVLITAAGTITGTPLVESDINSGDAKEVLLNTIFSKIESSLNENIHEDDSPVILLKDVQLRSNSGDSVFYEYLYIFVDDIIGISVAGTN